MKTRLFTLLLLTLCGFNAVSAFAQPTEPPPYAAYYNPATGFKPAQRDLTKVFLQMAGSLEHHGSPEPYIRHVLAEHSRISAKYKAATGKDNNSRPVYLTDAYVDKVVANWNKLESGLKLDALSRQSGRNMRVAIMGTWSMPVSELVAAEPDLTSKQVTEYRRLLEKPYFKKADLPAVNAFYEEPWDKLSDLGKGQISTRTWRGTMSPEKRDSIIQTESGGTLVVQIFNTHHRNLMEYLTTDSEKVVNSDDLENALKIGLKLDQQKLELTEPSGYVSDALIYSHAIKADFEKRFAFIDQNASSASDATNMKAALVSMAENLVVMAHLEFRMGLVELGTR